MDWATIGLSVFLGAVVQTTIIVMLYNHYIIPHIIKGVKEELMVSIDGWVDGMTAELSDTIATEINDNVLSLKRSFAGKRGREARNYSAALSYLTDNLTDDLSEEDQDDVIAAAVAKYSKPIVDAVLDKLWTSKKKPEVKAAAAEADPTAAGWC